MVDLYDDLIIKICDELCDREKIYVTMISKRMEKIRYKCTYREKIHVRYIVALPYFDNFESVEISELISILPKCAKYIYFEADTRSIPGFVTHLKFADTFNEPIKKSDIPTSVTHLELGDNYNQAMEINSISESVIYLKFGYWFYQSINNCVSSSVKEIELETDYDLNIDEDIVRRTKIIRY